MSIAWKLRIVFAAYAALLAVVLVFHAVALRHAEAISRELTAIAARHRVTSTIQLERLAAMQASAAKYLVTRDRGYLARFGEIASAYDTELRRIDSLLLGGDERDRLTAIAARWQPIERSSRSLLDSTTPPAAARAAALALSPALDELDLLTRRLADASHLAMSRALASSERSARSAERASLLVGLGTLTLGLLLLVPLVRSIVRPLDRLRLGTREIAAGRFGYRLRAAGTDELATVSRDFNAMAERLEQLDRMKGEFVSNVSHDLKTPLSSMQEATEALLDELPGPLTERQRRLLLLHQDSGRRLSSMLTKLLDLSRLELTDARALEITDFGGLVRRAVEHFNTARSSRGSSAVVTFHEGAGRLFLRADAEGIAQLLDNLLENALKFSPPDGVVRVSVGQHSRRRDTALLTVADEGPGIPDADKERVFERFHQTKAGRAIPARGVGLGLAICRHIVAAHRGAIRVADNQPRGSVFSVELPGLVAIDVHARAERVDLVEAPA